MTDEEKAAMLSLMNGLTVGEQIMFRGAPSNPYRLTTHRYSYEDAACECTACGNGIGVPWAGWFACENCPAIAFVATGQVFLPATRTDRATCQPGWDRPGRDPYEGCGWEPERREEASCSSG